jgi:hypothetical protein
MSEQVEVKYTGGARAFFYGLIPGAIGGGALIWLSFMSGCLDLQQQRTIAERMDNRVGIVTAKEEPKNPVKLVIQQRGCIRIDRAYMDASDRDYPSESGGKLTVYLADHCTQTPSYYEWHWKEMAPDGTIIHDGWTNTEPTVPEAGQTEEVTVYLPDDNRVVTVVVWATTGLK